MGKAAKLKKIRRLASQMPAINTMATVGMKAKGSELIEKGLTEVQGKDINPNGMYKGSQKVEVPMNHTKRMKKAYAAHGMKGVASYANAVVQFVKSKTPAPQP